MTTSALNPARFELHPDLERSLGGQFVRAKVIPRFTAAGECMVCQRTLGTRDALTVVSPSTADNLDITFAVALSPAHTACVPGRSGFLGVAGVEVVASATFRCVPGVFTDPESNNKVLVILLNPAIDQVVLLRNTDPSNGQKWIVHNSTGAEIQEQGWFRTQRDQPLLAMVHNPHRPSVGEIDLSGAARLWNGYTFHANTNGLANAAAQTQSVVAGALVVVSDLLAVPEATDWDLFKEFMTIGLAGRLDIR